VVRIESSFIRERIYLWQSIAPAGSAFRTLPPGDDPVTMQRPIIITALITLLLMLPFLFLPQGCVKHPRAPQAILLGVVLKQNTSPLFCEMESGIRNAAEKEGAQVLVLSPDGRETKGQEPLLEALIAKPVGAILLAPEDETSCVSLIMKAHSRGIPVILIDTDIDRTLISGADECIQTLVACDYKRGGTLAGEFLAKELKGRGTVAIMEGIPGRQTDRMRKDGFCSALKRYPTMNIVTAPPGNFEREKAFQAFNGLNAVHPELEGIFATNDLMAIAVSDAVRAHKKKPLCIIGFNATREGLAALKEGRIDGTVNQYPEKIAEIAVKSALRALKKEKLPPRQLVAPELIVKETYQMPFTR
jgi:ribose transport system substrate-binding protein